MVLLQDLRCIHEWVHDFSARGCHAVVRESQRQSAFESPLEFTIGKPELEPAELPAEPCRTIAAGTESNVGGQVVLPWMEPLASMLDDAADGHNGDLRSASLNSANSGFISDRQVLEGKEGRDGDSDSDS